VSDALKLKPCPFCGSTDIDSGRPWVSCNGCRCEGPYDTSHSDEDANRLWNTRADLPATDEQAFANEKVKALVEALQYYNTFGYEGKEARAALAAMETEE